MQIRIWGACGSCPKPLTRGEYRERLLFILEAALKSWRSELLSQSLPLKLPEGTAPPEGKAFGEGDILSSLPPEYAAIIAGETTCIEVSCQNSSIIIDMGSGIRRVGLSMLHLGISEGGARPSRREQIDEIHLLVTHTHWDHIQGWPFFLPAYRETTIHFHSCIEDLERRLVGQQIAEGFPIPFREMGHKAIFHYYPPGSDIELGPFQISTAQLIHPGDATAFKIRAEGKTFISASDTEFSEPDLDRQIEQYAPFFSGADLLLFDGQYSSEEAKSRKGWGHTAMPVAIDCAKRWKVKALLLTHHETSRSDHKTWQIFHDALQQPNALSSPVSQPVSHPVSRSVPPGQGPGQGQEDALKVFLACEGDLFDLHDLHSI